MSSAADLFTTSEQDALTGGREPRDTNRDRIADCASTRSPIALHGIWRTPEKLTTRKLSPVSAVR